MISISIYFERTRKGKLKMRTQLTDDAMLAAAQKRLGGHLETRPATKDEADAIRDTHLSEADRLEQAAHDAVHKPRMAAEIGHGPHAVDARHQESIQHSASLKEKMRLQQRARDERAKAAAWNDATLTVWQATRDELQARVDHYQRLKANHYLISISI